MANSGVVVVIAGQDNTDQVFKQIEANLQRTQARAAETENALERLGERGARALERIGIAIGVREAIEGTKELLTSSLEYGESINDASTKTGLAVQTLSVLKYAAGQTGTEFDAVSAAVAKMDKTIGQAASGNQNAAALLKSIGLNAADLAGRTDGAEIAFKRASQAIAATESPVNRVTLATGLFGKSGAELIETLIGIGNNFDYYKQKTNDAGLLLDGKTAEELEQTNRQLRDLQQRVQGAELAFTEGLIPGLQRMLSVISGGKSSRDSLVEWGQDIARVMAFVAEVVYSAASAVEFLFSASEGGNLTSAGAKDIAAAKQLQSQADQFHDIAFGPQKPFQLGGAPEGGGSGSGSGFGGTGDIAEQNKILAARKQLDAARLRLAEQGDSLRQQQARDAQDKALAQLDNEHKQQLVSDSDYYAQKLAIQNAAYDKQLDAAQKKEKDIDSAIAKLRADQKNKGAGSSEGIEDQAKIDDLQAKRLQVEGEIDKISTESAKNRLQAEQAIFELQQKRLATSDELAAQVEASHGLSVNDRLKQNDDQYAIQRRGLVAQYGADSVEVGDADQVDKTRRDRISASLPEDSYNAQLASINAQRSGVDAARSRGLISSQQQQRQQIVLNQQEAAALQPVLQAYERLADDDGDLAATAKVAELKEKIAELSTPVDNIALEIQDGFNGAFENLFTNLDQGSKAFENFGKSIERTLSNSIYKQFLETPINNLTSSLAGNISGSFGKVPVVGTQNEWSKSGGAGGFSIGKALGGLLGGGSPAPGGASGAAKGSGMSVTVTLVNDTDAQLKIGDIAKQGGGDLDKFEALLEKSFSGGGLMRQLLQGA